MNSKTYRSCAVPLCTNTSIKTPNKLFVFVPYKKTIRNKWLQLARRDIRGIQPRTRLYFCEDHFDMPNDMENYMQYHLMGSVSQIRMKPGCIPLKFMCQPDRRKRMLDRCEINVDRKRLGVGETSCGKSDNASSSRTKAAKTVSKSKAAKTASKSKGSKTTSKSKAKETVSKANEASAKEVTVKMECESEETASDEGYSLYSHNEEYVCSRCSKSIVGFRYTCVECENYDLCVDCEVDMTHPEHCMLRIPKLKPYRFGDIQSILEAVRDKIRSLSTQIEQNQMVLDEIKVEIDYDEPRLEDPLSETPHIVTSDITTSTAPGAPHVATSDTTRHTVPNIATPGITTGQTAPGAPHVATSDTTRHTVPHIATPGITTGQTAPGAPHVATSDTTRHTVPHIATPGITTGQTAPGAPHVATSDTTRHTVPHIATPGITTGQTAPGAPHVATSDTTRHTVPHIATPGITTGQTAPGAPHVATSDTTRHTVPHIATPGITTGQTAPGAPHVATSDTTRHTVPHIATPGITTGQTAPGAPHVATSDTTRHTVPHIATPGITTGQTAPGAPHVATSRKSLTATRVAPRPRPLSAMTHTRTQRQTDTATLQPQTVPATDKFDHRIIKVKLEKNTEETS